MNHITDHIDKLCVALAGFASHPIVLRYQQLRRGVHGWMFATGTRGIELLNASCLFLWAVALLDDRLVKLYDFFGAAVLRHEWANEVLAGVFMLAFIFSLAGVLRKDQASDKLASMGLQLGGLMWGGIALNFVAAYPPINTGALIYSLLALIAWSAGCYLSDD